MRAAHGEVNMGQAFKISDEQWERLNDATLRIVLERSDKLVASSLEQLRKSTDRAYTLFGFLLTVFSGITAYLIKCIDVTILLPCIVGGIGNCYCTDVFQGDMGTSFYQSRKPATLSNHQGTHRCLQIGWGVPAHALGVCYRGESILLRLQFEHIRKACKSNQKCDDGYKGNFFNCCLYNRTR